MKGILTIFSIIVFYSASGQSAVIKGSISDTINKKILPNAVIALLSAKDSTLQQFTRGDMEGNFMLKAVGKGSYVVMVTYPGFADYLYPLSVSVDSVYDLSALAMTSKKHLLEDVIVRQKIAAIRMRGDTIEYNADSFKVREGASVEEMLKKMPGLQIDKDGKITAQGENVEKVLVDGEEFFGDDPTVATKNLQADAIDKVQVFDKKSDQATFTGIDDGSKQKTINLTLKDDKKKGYFGKLQGGTDTKENWNNSAMFNKFRAKSKISVYGIMSSTGKTGLDWDESSKYGSNNDMEYEEDGGFFFSSGSSDEFDNYGSFSGEGIPKSWSSGLQYSNKFGRDKQNINGSYRYNKLNNQGAGNTVSQSILPGNSFLTKETRQFFNSKDRQAGNLVYDVQIDTVNSLKIKANANTGRQSSFALFSSESSDNTGNNVVNNRTTSANGTNKNINANLLFRHRFKKIGRTISLNVDQQYKATNSLGALNSLNNFYFKGNAIRQDSIDQKKVNDITNSGIYSKVAYTEPVVKNLFLELSYGLRISNSESKKLAFDKDQTGKYEALNDTFSNHFNFNVLTNSTGMVWRLNTKKVTASIGGDVAFAAFKQKNFLLNNQTNYNFTNLFPRAGFTYKFNANSRLSINYRGNTNQPTIEQIQPVRDNANPLNIAIGNADLKQEFRHSIDFNFNSYKVLKQRGLYSYGSFSTTTNSISTSETTDTSGVRIFQFINLNGNFNGYAGFGYNMKITPLDVNVNFGANFNTSRNINFVSSYVKNQLITLKNSTDNNSYGIRWGLYKYKENKFDLGYNGELQYNISNSTVNERLSTKYITQSHNFSVNFTLPYKFEINSNVEANLRQGTELFARNNVVKWNGYFGRKLLKNDKALISIYVSDILNQNIGFERTINSNIVRENSFVALRRYFLLQFVWNFSKNPGGAPTAQ